MSNSAGYNRFYRELDDTWPSNAELLRLYDAGQLTDHRQIARAEALAELATAVIESQGR